MSSLALIFCRKKEKEEFSRRSRWKVDEYIYICVGKVPFKEVGKRRDEEGRKDKPISYIDMRIQPLIKGSFRDEI